MRATPILLLVLLAAGLSPVRGQDIGKCITEWAKVISGDGPDKFCLAVETFAKCFPGEMKLLLYSAPVNMTIFIMVDLNLKLATRNLSCNFEDFYRELHANPDQFTKDVQDVTECYLEMEQGTESSKTNDSCDVQEKDLKCVLTALNVRGWALTTETMDELSKIVIRELQNEPKSCRYHIVRVLKDLLDKDNQDWPAEDEPTIKCMNELIQVETLSANEACPAIRNYLSCVMREFNFKSLRLTSQELNLLDAFISAFLELFQVTCDVDSKSLYADQKENGVAVWFGTADGIIAPLIISVILAAAI